MIPDAAQLMALQARMHTAARGVRLPLRNKQWRGSGGAWSGQGAGSSLDFQDHRPYYLGDDPRHIDWQAYARTGHYTMKLYREEVSPSIDLVMDVSASMFLNEEKATRSLELFYFAAASAQRLRGALRAYWVAGERVMPVMGEAIFAPQTLQDAVAVGEAKGAEASEGAAAGGGVRPVLETVPWRAGSLRILISDLLYPGAPLLSPLAGGRGRGVVLAPWCRAEGAPDWAGNIELRDCESGARRMQRVDAGVLTQYRAAYSRHFELWRTEARRCGVILARVAGAEIPFLEAIHQEALPQGAVETA